MHSSIDDTPWRAAGRGRFGRVYFLAEADSTNSRAMELVRSGEGEGVVVIADTQTAGRGRLGRSWISPAGLNLYMSVVVERGNEAGPYAVLPIGLVVALDVQTGKHHPIYGMGRHNHENSVSIPGFDDLVVLSGDDTFTNGALTGVTFPAGVTVPAQAQLYSYIASDTDTLLADEGELYAFVSDTPGFTDYYDFTPGSAQSITGHFIQVPKNIATGLNPDGSEIKAANVGFPLPPTNGSWQRDNRTTVPTGLDGPQWVLEYWSDINNVFQFVRIEDIAYDKRPGMDNVVYVVVSDRGVAGSPQAGRSTNGRVWKMVLDPNDQPCRAVRSFWCKKIPPGGHRVPWAGRAGPLAVRGRAWVAHPQIGMVLAFRLPCLVPGSRQEVRPCAVPVSSSPWWPWAS